MEETLQQEAPESEYKNQNEDQGGIRRRLRDRDLLKKRKAEAEEKEFNQEESTRKRQRAEQKSGASRRGRPRKPESTPEVSLPQEGPPAVGVSEPVEASPDLTSVYITSSLSVGSDVLESQYILDSPVPLPAFVPEQSPAVAATLAPPALVTPALASPSALAPSPAIVVDATPVPDQDLRPAPEDVAAPAVATAPSIAPPQVETLSTESQARETQDPVLVEDLGPDEEEDIPPTQDRRADEDLTEIPLPEQNKTFSVTSLSSVPPQQEYLPGNQF